MSNPVQSQGYIFLATVYGGIIIGFIFDLYRIFRYYSKPRKVASFIEDFVFWMIVVIVAFFVLLFSNWGEIRGFVFIGFICGAFLYLNLLSKFVIAILVKVIKYVSIVVKTIINIIFYPFRIICIPFIKIINKIKGRLNKIKRFIKLPQRIILDIKKYTKSIILKNK